VLRALRISALSFAVVLVLLVGSVMRRRKSEPG